jgi:hypothetical protein
MAVGGKRRGPAVLTPGKTRYSFNRGLNRPQGQYGRVRNITPLPGFDPPHRPARSETLYRLTYPGPL